MRPGNFYEHWMYGDERDTPTPTVPDDLSGATTSNALEPGVPITSLDQLRQLAQRFQAQRKYLSIYVLLEGCLHSRKSVQYVKRPNGRNWWVEHTYDPDYSRFYTERQLYQDTNIVSAIRRDALFAYGDQFSDSERQSLIDAAAAAAAARAVSRDKK